VKADEIKWSGIEQALASLEKDGKVSKEDLLNYLRNEGRVRFEEVTLGAAPSVYQENGRWYVKGQENLGYSDSKEQAEELASRPDVIETASPPKFSQYVLPGGENYREVVLAITDKAPQLSFNQWYNESYGTNVFGKFEDLRPESKKYFFNEYKKQGGVVGNIFDTSEYTSSHFPDIPNYVAHMRTNERTLDDGSEGLFVEEFQSDRHQEGRKKGYVTTENEKQSASNRIKEIRKLQNELDSNSEQYKKLESEVPELARTISTDASGRIADAPFRTTWPIQLFKRALRDAVDGGKDWIGWTTGETQNDRFDLSKQAEKLYWYPEGDGNGVLIASSKAQGDIINERIAEDKIEDYVGKEVARRLLDAKPSRNDLPHKLSGVDLKIGGSGMKGFYDNMLPKEVGKYVKQFGGKVEKADMTQSVEADIMSGEEAETGSVPIWKVNITPEMRKISQTGQMRFMPEGKNAPKSTKISAKQQQSKTSAISRMAVVNEDEEQSRRKARRSTAKGNASAIANAAKLK
jgi:hypothetical protein